MLSNFILFGSPIPTSWTFYGVYDTSTTITIPHSGWYRVYCIGKSGDGGSEYESGNPYDGLGGGGSGGMAISHCKLGSGESGIITISDGIASFASTSKVTSYSLRANPGAVGRQISGGSGGAASGGNVVNLSGFTGGSGGPSGLSRDGGNGYAGNDGSNGGMQGGFGGSGNTDTQYAGGGGGGGARLPGEAYCKYVSPVYTDQYRAARGGNYNSSTSVHAQPYPSITLNQNIVLFGGGGGRGGRGRLTSSTAGNHSSGTPAVVIIETA